MARLFFEQAKNMANKAIIVAAGGLALKAVCDVQDYRRAQSDRAEMTQAYAELRERRQSEQTEFTNMSEFEAEFVKNMVERE
jgi:hypothetical protein